MRPLTLPLPAFATLLVLLVTTPAVATDYKIDYANSQITFSGMHAGNHFTGEFQNWQAAIDFNRDNPTSSKVTASIDMTSAHTGNTTYDKTLPKPDWFAVNNHPGATFTSTTITGKGDHRYHMDGTLTIRGISHPQAFDFTLREQESGQVRAQGEVMIDRLAYDIGKGSDPKAEWVSRNIPVTIDVLATPTP